MSEGAPSYPISVLLQQLIERHGPSPTEFVQRLGYRNIERGLRRLRPWLEVGDGFDYIIRQISKTVPDVADPLKVALAETKAIKGAAVEAAFLEQCRAEEPTFVPYVHAQGERTVPNGICIFGVSGGFRRWTAIVIPKTILDLPLEEQLERMPELMAAYTKQYKGACPFFGKLTGFRFVRLLDYFQFDKAGKFIQHVDKPFRTGCVSVSLR
jgi:hypothetical protein